MRSRSIVPFSLIALALSTSACSSLEKKPPSHPGSQSAALHGKTDGAPEGTMSGGTSSAADAASPNDAQQILVRIPSEGELEGDVQIQVLGFTEIRPNGDESVRIPALHLRMIPRNEKSVTDWNIDSRLQQIRFTGAVDMIRPLFVESASETLPFIRVPRGQSLEIDLYFAIPGTYVAANASTFELNWQLLASDATTNQVSRFNRPAIDAAAPVVTPGAGRIWWQDPFSR